jgi:hypothetical protein
VHFVAVAAVTEVERFGVELAEPQAVVQKTDWLLLDMVKRVAVSKVVAIVTAKSIFDDVINRLVALYYLKLIRS